MPEEKVDQRLDLRGEVCPYPTAKTSVILKKMAAVEVLEVTTEFYPARQTIPKLMGKLEYPCDLSTEKSPFSDSSSIRLSCIERR